MLPEHCPGKLGRWLPVLLNFLTDKNKWDLGHVIYFN